MTTLQYNPQTDLNDFFAIVGQVTADRAVSSQTRAKAAWLDREAVKISGNLAAEYAAPIVAAMATVASAMRPVATTTWTREELDILMSRVRAFSQLGAYDADSLALIHDAVLQVSGRRSSRGVTEVMDGRPTKVTITTNSGTRICAMSGNKPSSSGNLRGAVKRYVQDAGHEYTPELRDAVKRAVWAIVECREEVAEIGTFATVTGSYI